MRLTLVESDRSVLRSTELITLSVATHVAVLGLISAGAVGSFRLPADEREARAQFLLPPDPAPPAERTADIPLPGKPGSGLDEASSLPEEGQGMRLVGEVKRSRAEGEKAGAKTDGPLGPAPFLEAKVYSAIEVDEMVERFASSAAPVYPPELEARGTEGAVEAQYVVDLSGRVDTSTIQVMHSDHPRFTESVRTSLAEARFRPAKRGGQAVRQLVAQRFRFKLAE